MRQARKQARKQASRQCVLKCIVYMYMYTIIEEFSINEDYNGDHSDKNEQACVCTIVRLLFFVTAS